MINDMFIFIAATEDKTAVLLTSINDLPLVYLNNRNFSHVILTSINDLPLVYIICLFILIETSPIQHFHNKRNHEYTNVGKRTLTKMLIFYFLLIFLF